MASAMQRTGFSLQVVTTKQHIMDGKHSANFCHGVQVTIIMGGCHERLQC